MKKLTLGQMSGFESLTLTWLA